MTWTGADDFKYGQNQILRKTMLIIHFLFSGGFWLFAYDRSSDYKSIKDNLQCLESQNCAQERESFCTYYHNCPSGYFTNIAECVILPNPGHFLNNCTLN